MRKRGKGGRFRPGFTMSRRARLAIRHNEHPITYWKDRLVMEEDQISKLLIFMGNHHVGAHGVLMPFYRLPDKHDTAELMKIYHAFHEVAARKLNFIRVLSTHLQQGIEENGRIVPLSSRPRKKTKRRKFARRRRKSAGFCNKKKAKSTSRVHFKQIFRIAR